MDSLVIINEKKSHVYIKDFGRFMFHKTKNKKQYFCKSCLQCFSSKNVLIEHKEVCLSINGKIKLEKEAIEFAKAFKQIQVQNLF